MSIRDEILKATADEDEREQAAKIIDLVMQVIKHHEPKFTQFLDPAQAFKASKILDQFHDVRYIITSNIPDCERNIVAIFPDYMGEDDIAVPISALCITGNYKFESINHRDVLGALMNLGIKREKIGDIIIGSEKSYVIVFNDICSYITTNLTRIKHVSVTTEYCEFSDVPCEQENFKIISATVASLRLDAVIGAGYGESRSSLSEEIKKGSVKVNWEVVTDLSFKVAEGDTISLRGKGRIIVDSVGGQTKKGRVNVTFKRLL